MALTLDPLLTCQHRSNYQTIFLHFTIKSDGMTCLILLGLQCLPNYVFHIFTSLQRRFLLPLYHVEFALLDFRSRLESSIYAAQITSKRKHNLTPNELSAYFLKKNRPDIVISKADKNLGTVNLNKDDYIAEGLRQLADRKYYSPVSSDNQALHDSLYRDLRHL